MSQLSPQELEKVRKAAIQSVTLSSEMKTSVVDAKLRELSAEIKKVLTRKNKLITFFIMHY